MFDLDTSNKPAVPASWAQSGFRMAGPRQDQWECGVCELKNSTADAKCTVCEAARPGAAAVAAPQAAVKRKASSELPVFEFDLDTSKKPLRPR
ncbi:hypothetical protein GGF43_000930 [Coemansia sp. RSA 2618]|nr:hypothetical protein GGF43_000930 [Coemansia sp. RSA 2618]